VKRRSLFQLCAGAIAAGVAGFAAFRFSEWRKPALLADPAATLSAYVDALVPADGEFPGAVAIGVIPRLLAAIPAEAAYRKLIHEGVLWLDAQARNAGSTSFAALPPAERERIVASAEASPSGSMQRVFFQATRDDVLFHTYTDARSWNGLGYDGPPQPRGFLDYTQPLRQS